MSQHQFEENSDISNYEGVLERVEAKLHHLRTALDVDKAEWERVQQIVDRLKTSDD